MSVRKEREYNKQKTRERNHNINQRHMIGGIKKPNGKKLLSGCSLSVKP
jgi:hypothetical protein